MAIQGIRFESAPAAYVTKSPSFKGSKKVSLPDAEKMKSATLQLGATALAAIASANIIKSNQKPIPVEKLDYSSFDKIEGELTNNGKSKVVKNNDGIIIREYGKGRNGKLGFVKDYDKNGNLIKYTTPKIRDVVVSDYYNKKGVQTKLSIYSKRDKTLHSIVFDKNGIEREHRFYCDNGKTLRSLKLYCKDGSPLQDTFYFLGSKTASIVKDYGENGLVRETTYNEDGSVISITNYDEETGVKYSEKFFYDDGVTVQSVADYGKNETLLRDTFYREDGTLDSITEHDNKRIIYYEEDGKTIDKILELSK